VKKALPSGSDEWEEVATCFNAILEKEVNGYVPRSVESLRNKFKAGYLNKKKTGDPTMPSWVREAKHIQYLIEEKCGMRAIDDVEEVEDDVDELADAVFEVGESDNELELDESDVELTEEKKAFLEKSTPAVAKKKTSTRVRPSQVNPDIPSSVKRKRRIDSAIEALIDNEKSESSSTVMMSMMQMMMQSQQANQQMMMQMQQANQQMMLSFLSSQYLRRHHSSSRKSSICQDCIIRRCRIQ